MGQSFMGGGLDLASFRDGDDEDSRHSGGAGGGGGFPADDLPQAAVDDMLSNILNKTKTDLRHSSPSLVESPQRFGNTSLAPAGAPPPPSGPPLSEPPPPAGPPPTAPPPYGYSYPPPLNQYGPDPSYYNQAYMPGVYTGQPGYYGSSYQAPADSVQQEENNGGNAATASTTPDPEPSNGTKIERKWGNILKSEKRKEEENPPSASSPKFRKTSEHQLEIASTDSVSPFSDSNSSPKWSASYRHTRQDSELNAVVSPRRSKSPESHETGGSPNKDPKKQKGAYKDPVKDFPEVHPKNMSYCGKEFLEIVDAKTSSGRITTEAICHLCRIAHLNPNDLAGHLDGEKHYKNMRNFIMEKEYDEYQLKCGRDPLLEFKYPDFNTYMLSRYPTKVDEYFYKDDVFDETSRKTRTVFRLKYKPAKMLLDVIKYVKPIAPPTDDQKSECPYCSLLIPNTEILDHHCDAMKASEQAKIKIGRCKSGVPVRSKKSTDIQDDWVTIPNQTVIPAYAVDVQPKLEMCREFQRLSQCQYGVKCMFAHYPKEIGTMTYRRTKTECCNTLGCNGRCPKAHDKDELVVIKYKTELCRAFTETKNCQYIDNCQFAHGMGELLSPWDSTPLGKAKGADEDEDVIITQTNYNRMQRVDPFKNQTGKIKLTLKKNFRIFNLVNGTFCFCFLEERILYSYCTCKFYDR